MVEETLCAATASDKPMGSSNRTRSVFIRLGGYVALLLGALSVACGGAGGRQNAPPTNFGSLEWTIEWPERSRDIPAPSSALSVLVEIAEVPGERQLAVVRRNRPSELGRTQTPMSSPDLPFGSCAVRVSFFSQPDQSGVVVAQATTMAILDATRVSLGTVTPSGVVKRVVAQSASVSVGQSKQLAFTAYSESGEIVALTEGSARWSLESGDGFATLTSAGVVSGVAPGEAVVRATVDDVRSDLAAVQVLAPSGRLTWESLVGIMTYDGANHDRKPDTHEYCAEAWLTTLRRFGDVGLRQVRTTVAYDRAATGLFLEDLDRYQYLDALVQDVLGRRLPALRSGGFRTLVLTFQTYRDSANPWPLAAEDRRRFVGWVVGILRQVKSRNLYPFGDLIVQIGNEPSQDEFNGRRTTLAEAEGYVATLRAVLDELDRGGPEVRVISGAYNNTDFPGSRPNFTLAEWLDLLQVGGVLSRLYGVSLHAYRGRYDQDRSVYVPEASYPDIDLIRQRLSGNQEVVVTEAGSHHRTANGEAGLLFQERAALRYLLLALAKDVKHLILYEAKDRKGSCVGMVDGFSCTENGDIAELSFGMMSQAGDLYPSGRSVVATMQTYGAYSREGGVEDVAPYRHRLVIGDGVHRVRIQWSSKESEANDQFPLKPWFQAITP